MIHEIEVDGRPARLLIDGTRFRYQRGDADTGDRDFSIEPAGAGRFSVLVGGRSYEATVLSGGEISVNGRTFRAEVIDPREWRSKGSAGGSAGRQKIAAPMPGRVIRVLVEVNQHVEAGQGLIVVEAMKMQNEMKSPKAGRVAEIKTATGAAVNAGEVLMVIE